MKDILHEELDFNGDNRFWWRLDLGLYETFKPFCVFLFVAGGVTDVHQLKSYQKIKIDQWNQDI